MSKHRKFLTEYELTDFFSAIDNMRDFLIFGLIFEAGLRPGEVGYNKRASVSPLLIRNIEDILLDRDNLIHIDRAKHHPEGRDAILINNVIIEELKKFVLASIDSVSKDKYIEYIKSIRDKPLFLSQKNNIISLRQVQALFKKYCEKAGISNSKQHPHILRHSHAVSALKNGVDLESIRQNLGHDNIKTTSVYLEMTMDDAIESYKKANNWLDYDRNV